MADEMVLVGEKSGKILNLKERSIQFPNLNNIAYKFMRSDGAKFFPSEVNFIHYLKDIVEYSDKAKVLAAFGSIYEEICDNSDWESDAEEEIYNKIYDSFADILYRNFPVFLSLYNGES